MFFLTRTFHGCFWSKHHLATGLLDLISGLHESWIVTCQFDRLKDHRQNCMFLHVESVKKGEFEAPKYGFPMGAAFKDFETLQGAFTNEGVRATGKKLEVSFL